MTHLGSPPTARPAARDGSRPADWAGLTAALDRWAAAGRRATFWWRDDDAVAVTPALETLIGLSERHHVPLALAVIPDGAEPALAARLARSDAPIAVLQHGFAHRNHAPDGEKSVELGPHRPLDSVTSELLAGRETLTALFGGRFFAALVPPWNRIGPEVAAAVASLGYRGLSTFEPRPAGTPAHVNTHIDIIDWHGSRGFAGEAACLGAAIAHLSDRLDGRCDPDEPTGLLSHHLVHDQACWRFIDRFLAETRSHAAASWVSAPDAFREAGG